MVYSFCVVEYQVVHQSLVEDNRIHEFIDVVINIFLLDCPVESFAVSIHLGSSGVGMVMNHMELTKLCREVLGKFRSVVRQDVGERKGKYFMAELKELTGRQ